MQLTFSDDQLKRYGRNILLKEVGGHGQARILSSRVLVVGTGGLGSPIAYYLAAAGVGRLGIVDDDVVDLSNLQRQILHSTPDLARPKVESAREKLLALNPEMEITSYQLRLSSDNANEIISKYDIVVDATDNFNTRNTINEACILTGKPFIHGGVLGLHGQLTTIVPGEGPCFCCVFGFSDVSGSIPTCVQAGVLGAVPGTIGALQAIETLKWILGIGDLLIGRLLMFNGLSLSFREVSVSKNTECPVCGGQRKKNSIPPEDFDDK